MDEQHERKTFEFKVTDFDYEGRTVEGYAAVFGNIDQGNDIIHPGAFAKTLVERGNKVRFLWQHDMHEPIGRPLELREDASGLFIKAIVSDTARGRDALALMRDNAISGLSIGYDAIPGGTDYSKEDGTGVRNLRELRLWEFSLVTFPMNELANVTALKDNGDKSIDLTQRVDSVRSAFGAEFNPGDTYRFWVSTVYDDHIIVEGEMTVEFFSVAYAIDENGDITFAPESEWTPGEYVFIPVIKSGDEAQERKNALVASLRTALAEAEALLADALLEVPSAPAEDAGRDVDADDQGAGPVIPPTSEDTERLRARLLESLASLED